MSAKIISSNSDEVTISMTVKFKKSMLDSEEEIQNVLNMAGTLATQESLKRFDTDGSEIVVGQMKLTSKGKVSKIYETPYGPTLLKTALLQHKIPA